MRYAFNCNREQGIALMMVPREGQEATDKDVFIVKPINPLYYGRNSIE